MATWTVRYKDGRIQSITSDTYGPHGDNHVFESKDIGHVAVIDRKDVESVARDDVPPPKTPDPVIA
jgi:hypothetical protein